jgi:hypothetical protein
VVGFLVAELREMIELFSIQEDGFKLVQLWKFCFELIYQKQLLIG